ncbi:AAA family ATPase [Ramlibacter montanisoli]|uniref:AAA family ATPase n=1 Tax=Ramlibacter montanisoli TaxID=2732512 RepID=UPI00281536F4|nr:AAA family ATPase [Ramlibacter montanisoli]
MSELSLDDAGHDDDASGEMLWQDGERAFCRISRRLDTGTRQLCVAVVPGGDLPPAAMVRRLRHEFELREHLDGAWALRPLELIPEGGRAILVLEDHGGEPLERLLGAPMELGRFLRVAIAITEALGQLHGRGLVHKDMKPGNVFVDAADRVRLTGFGIASRLPRERQAPEPPEVIAGTLAYMAPEQTGRMNRSIDTRSDLYSLGVTFYQMLTGTLPFSASDPMGWVHCHIAKRPVPPAERAWMPAAVSHIVLKLLAKTAEDRYQTTAGVAADLKRCRALLEATGAVPAFPLGTHDVPDALRIPEKLYGREAEVAALLAAFERVIAHGTPELVLVRGYSGVGKSSVVSELHKAIVQRRGLFASGKFEQYRRDVPYATVAQAFRSLMRQLLARSEPELARWRQSLTEALAGQGELMVRIIPELELLVGAQPTVPELPPQDAQARFQRVFRRLVGVFARPEHPLVLFLDDLQWLDAATLTLLADLATHSEVHDLLLVGAYRDNEVDASHPLMRSLEAIRAAGASVGEIVLAPLALHDVGALIADSLHCDVDGARHLTRLVHEKTGGNPFFAIQFLGALGEEKLLAYDAGAAAWVADLARIHAKGYTDNVVDLMVGKLARLPGATCEGLKQLACLGSVARFGTLERIFGQSADAVHASLWDAVRDGLLLRTGEGYAFVHDRVQEAAYSLVDPHHRPAVHLSLARALLRDMHPDEVIDVVDQFNRGAALLVDPQERERIAQLDLLAGRRAKSSAAYASAATYFAAGMRLLPDDAWSRRYELAFGLWLERAECEHLGGNLDAAEPIICGLLSHCASKADRAAAYRLKIDLHVMKGENAKAIDSAVACLGLLGIEICAHPTRAQVETELAKVWRNLGDRPIESLAGLPPMTDPEKQAAMLVLSVIYAPAYFTDRNLLHLHMCHMVNLTLEHGTSEASAAGYACFGVTVGPNFGRYADGYRFCRLACDMVERPELAGYRPKVYVSTEMAFLWTQPVGTALHYVQAAQRAAIEAGDPAIGCYAATHIVTDLLLRGDHLDDVLRESERGVEFARKANFRDIVDVIRGQQQFVQDMRGRTAHFSTFSGAGFDETAFEAALTPDRMATMMCFYWLLKLQARFLSGDLDAALDAAARAKALLWSADGHIQLVDYHFHTALTIAAGCRAPSGARPEASETLAAHLAQLAQWVDNGAASFRDRHALLQAEAARVAGRDLDAQRLYEQAIRLARQDRFIHNEALASELAGRFYADRGFEEIAALYLKKARGCYLRWGAAGKVRQLDEAHPGLRDEEAAAAATGTIGAPVEHLDLATVLKVSQAVSGEIVLEKMLETLMLTAIEHAGAERGVLTLAVAGEQRVAAEATTTGDRVAVQLRDQALAEAAVPQSVFLYVLRTQEAVVLDDAVAHGPFSGDPYIVERRTRSVLCLPLLKQGKVTGVLYLENNLAARAFAPSRLATLKLLASEAAMSLENSRLYRDLAVREARIRRLVEANIIGIFIWDTRGRVLDANDAFLRMVGYDREDLVSRRLRWTELTPPEWREQDEQHAPALKVAGSLQPYEKEYFRKDGSRVPVLIGAAMYEEASDEGVAFVLDLSERKRAEHEARRSERRLHEMQMRLVDANRIATAGHLSAAIAHELNQPLAGMVTNASTCLRRLAADPPNVEGASETARRMIRDANRASDVIQRLRALFGNKETAAEWLDLNEAAQEVIALSSAALQKDRVSVHCELAEDLPPVRGDRVQLQQVIMNLLRNAGTRCGTWTNDPGAWRSAPAATTATACA